MALILGEGEKDFISGDKMDFTNFVADSVDLHHIFPQKYCEDQDYEKRKWNCIVNKTPIAYLTNRKIGSVAPSKYSKVIEDTNVSADALNRNIESHGIDVSAFRNDYFDTFFALRAKLLLDMISNLDSTEVIYAFGIPLV